MDDQQIPSRKGRGFRWALGISLALNLIFVGVFAGAALRHMGDSGKGPGPQMQSFGAPMSRALPPDARRALRRQLRKELAGVLSRRERQALYGQILTALRADPFDATDVSSLFAVQRDVAGQVQDRAQEVWLEIVSGMSVEDRRLVADRLQEALSRSRKKRKPQQ